MLNKVFSMMLVFLTGCSLFVVAVSQQDHSNVKENKASNSKEEPVVTSAASSSSWAVISDDETDMYSTGIPATAYYPEYVEWYYGAPDDILSGPTPGLLEYFMESPFLGEEVFTSASTPDSVNYDIDYSWHEAFRELISREDCLETLEHYAGSVRYGSKSDERNIELEIEKTKFRKLLIQPAVKSLVSDLPDTDGGYPNLRNIYMEWLNSQSETM